MNHENEQTTSPESRPIHLWFLQPWTPYGIAGIATLTTVVFGFRQDWKLAIAVVIVGCGLSSTSWILRFYYRQLREREQQRGRQYREKLELLESEYAGKLEAREAVTGAREEHIRTLTEVIRCRDKALAEQLECRDRVAQALLRFIQDCKQENDKMHYDFESIKDRPAAIAAVLRHGLAHSFLQTALERLIQVFQVLVPAQAIWGAVRQYVSGAYVTAARAGDYDPVRAKYTEPMTPDRSIARLIREQYSKDGVGIVITSPDDPAYDKVDGDRFNENLSIMAGPIIRTKMDAKGQIKIEMPMWIALNSPTANIFQEHFRYFMAICVHVLSELLKDWPEIIKGQN